MYYDKIVSKACCFAVLFLICSGLSARTIWWKPERTLGAERLSLQDVAVVYLPAEPSAGLEAAVADLVECWPSALEQREAEIAPSKQSLILMRDEGVEGFIYHRDRTRVYLRSSTDEGLASGLYAISRELLGARWYWAGALGFETVGEPAEKFPDRVWREQPAFVQRTLHPVETDFGRRNGLNRKYSFNHNLARIFTQEVYDASPEVFAEIGGRRQPPSRSAKYDPQPDFTEPKTVELAVSAAREHFDKEPQPNSFSLSINDNVLFDEGAETEAVVKGQESGVRSQETGGRRQEAGGRRQETGGRGQALTGSDSLDGRGVSGEIEYFRGRPNYTDLVFGFMNEVAERLERAEDGELKPEENGCRSQVSGLKSQPSAPYLTALAYYWTEQSPSFQLHPRVMPVLTSDRAQWHDPIYRAEDKALIQRWAHSGADRIATWDYYYGAPYPYPRQFTQWIGESLRYLHDAGVDVFFSQLPSIWGLDGPKAWLTAELLRDPEQEVVDLLSEYYENFFGMAAEPIRQFYEIAEQTRNARAGTANWIKFYKDEAGVELFDAGTLQLMRAKLSEAEQLLRGSHGTETASALRGPQGLEPDRYLARVQIVSEAFSYTEAYAAYHRSRVRLVESAMAVLRGDSQAREGAALVAALADYHSAKASFDELKRVLVENPLHGGFSTFNRLMQSDPLALAMAALARVDAPKESPQLSMLRAWQAGKASFVPVGKNPSLKHTGTELRNFLGPKLPVMDAWQVQYRASEGLQVDPASGEDRAGLRIEHADIVSLAQAYPVVAEELYLLQIEASWRVSPDNRTRVQLNWQSMTGERLQTDLLLRLPNGTSAGTQLLEFAVTSPVNAYDLTVGVITNRQYEGDYLEVQRVELGQFVPDR